MVRSLQSPIISIVVIVYATEQYLRRALDSLINQTLQNIEIIVVNDASPGNCSEIVKEYQEKDKRIILVEHEKQKGKLQARLSGFLHSNGLYIQHLDSDDSLTLDACTVLANTLQKSNADASYCSLQYIQSTSSKSFMPHSPKHSCIVTNKDMLLAFCNYTYQESREFTLLHSLALFCIKREVYTKAYEDLKDMPNFYLYEDLLHAIAFIPHITTLVCIENALYNYYIGLSAYSQNYKDHLIERLYNLIGVLDCSEKILLQYNLCTVEDFSIRRDIELKSLYNMLSSMPDNKLLQQIENSSKEALLSYIIAMHNYNRNILLRHKTYLPNISLFKKLLLRYEVKNISKSIKQIKRGFLALILSICLLVMNGIKKIYKIFS